MQYLTQEWAEEALRLIETDEAVLHAVRHLDLSLLSIILNGPEDAYGFIYVAFKDGGLEEYRVGHDYTSVAGGMPKPTFTVSGDYKTFAQVQKGELSERRALLRGRLHLTGSLRKAIRHMRAMETVTAALRRLPCTA